jgi:hypothetical protein
MALKWEAPTEDFRPRGRISKWAGAAEELRAHPNQWALLGEEESISLASYIRNGGISCFEPAGSFESATRDAAKTGRGRIYARYVGEPQQKKGASKR